MIDCGPFRFASAPRTGTAWFCQCLAAVGVGEFGRASVHIPHDVNSNCCTVTIVRHPCDWLASYFGTIRGGHTYVDAVDQFSQLPRDDFDWFIRLYLKRMAGSVGRLFDRYHANCVLRLEDMPQAMIELVCRFGVTEKIAKRIATVAPANRNIRKLPIWNPSLYARVVDAERDFLKRYDYL